MKQTIVTLVKVVVPPPQNPTDDVTSLVRAFSLVVGGLAFLVALILMGTVLWTAISG